MFKPQQKIAATYMRGGTSKGVFFKLSDLPHAAQKPGAYRDQLLLAVIGSPDPYAKHTDGMGGATSSTSKVVIVSPSTQADHDVDYLFGQVAIDTPFIDWSGNCGNLTAAVGAFAISEQLIAREKIPENGIMIVRVWQANIKQTILVHVPITNGMVQETGDFQLDGVTNPSAEIKLEFINPAAGSGMLLPTENVVDQLTIPDIGVIPATFINAGIATIFVNAADIGYSAKELQQDINNDPQALQKLEKIRRFGAVSMGLINTPEDRDLAQHTPKLVFIAQPGEFVTSSGKHIMAEDINILARAMSMGKLHHAMMGTAAVALAAAAAIEGSLVNIAAGGGVVEQVTFGHPSGLLSVGAQVLCDSGKWSVAKVTMSRSARIIMKGQVYIDLSQLE